jgi:hypothetical protein
VAIGLHQAVAKRPRIAIERDRAARLDAGPRQQSRELRGLDRPVVRVAEVALGVPEDGARDVAAVVGRRAHVEFDDPERGVDEVLCNPLWVGDRRSGGANVVLVIST